MERPVLHGKLRHMEHLSIDAFRQVADEAVSIGSDSGHMYIRLCGSRKSHGNVFLNSGREQCWLLTDKSNL
jgi:hypothetical protein